MSEQVDVVLPEETSPILCLPIDSANALLSKGKNEQYHRFLMPFRAWLSTEHDLDLMLRMTRQANGKLILLHMGEEADLDEESLFTAFRGLQNHANQILADVIIDNIKGDTAVSLMEYAHNHKVDLIVFPEEQLVS